MGRQADGHGEGIGMMREQAVIKAAGAEVPVLALSEPGFWVLVAMATAVLIFWIWSRKSSGPDRAA